MKNENSAHGFSEGSEVPTEQEIKAYLNYEDVQKELETARQHIENLLEVAEEYTLIRSVKRKYSIEYNEEWKRIKEIIRTAKQFLK